MLISHIKQILRKGSVVVLLETVQLARSEDEVLLRQSSARWYLGRDGRGMQAPTSGLVNEQPARCARACVRDRTAHDEPCCCASCHEEERRRRGTTSDDEKMEQGRRRVGQGKPEAQGEACCGKMRDPIKKNPTPCSLSILFLTDILE